MDAVDAFVRKVDAIERISGERPTEVTIHPADFTEIKALCLRGEDRYQVAAAMDGVQPLIWVCGILVKTDRCQTRLRRE